ncbi:MAG: ATP/GTP-binding protein [Desulfurococcales archaeon]|jgi:GTPase SAR1 family protein|nr:ATP/GTP-binding protein [Desulfurococcales archaeon]
MYFIYLVGPAGSGKTSLATSLGEWMISNQLDVSIVNMDPAVESLPYTPDIDIRRFVNARDVMYKFNLGPNGALIASVDMSINHLDTIRDMIEERNASYYIVDTPGQMEIFAFRPAGPLIIERLSEGSNSLVLFLVDMFMASRASSLASLLFLFLSTWLRLRRPQILVLTKADLYPKEVVSNILSWIEDPHSLLENARREGISSHEEEIILGLSETAMHHIEAVPVSSITWFGLDDLYAMIQRIFAGGEDYYTEEGSPRL